MERTKFARSMLWINATAAALALAVLVGWLVLVSPTETVVSAYPSKWEPALGHPLPELPDGITVAGDPSALDGMAVLLTGRGNRVHVRPDVADRTPWFTTVRMVEAPTFRWVIHSETEQSVLIEYVDPGGDTPHLTVSGGPSGEERAICRWPWQLPLVVDLSVGVDEDQVVVETDDGAWRCGLDAPLVALEHTVEPPPAGALLYVDRVLVERERRGSGDVLARATFDDWPANVQLLPRIGIPWNSTLGLALALLLCLAVGVVLDALALRVHPWFRSRASNVYLGFWLLSPAQWLVIIVARGVLGLPPLSVLIGMACLLVARMVWLFGAQPRSGGPPRRSTTRAPVWVSVVTLGSPLLALLAANALYSGPYYGSFAAMTLAVWILGSMVIPLETRNRRWLGVVRAVVGTLAVLACVEMSLRATDRLDTSLDLEVRASAHAWPLEATTAVLGPPALPFGATINREKPAGAFRVVCLGSSTTEGFGASGASTTYPGVLEQLLGAGAGPKVEVVNGGLGGAPLYMLRVYLEDVLLPLDPDVVVLYYGVNGESTWARELHRRVVEEKRRSPHLDSDEEMWAALQLRWSPAWLVEGFVACARTRTFVALLLAADWARHRGDPETDREERVVDRDVLAQTAGEIIDACERDGTPLLMIPEVCSTGHPGGPECHRVDLAFARAMEERDGDDIHLVSLSDDFDAQQRLEYFIDEVHMTDEGYAYLAARVEAALVRSGLGPGAQ